MSSSINKTKDKSQFIKKDRSYLLISVIIFLLMVIIPEGTFAQDEDYPTAQEKISVVNAAVHAIAPDAKIMAVDGGAVTLKGESHRWIYIYITPNRKMYEYWYEDNELKARSSISKWEDFNPHRKMAPVPDAWMDSDSALVIAEENGGSAFRATHGSQTEIEMRLMPPAIGSGVGFFALYPQSVWYLHYRFEEHNFGIIMNAVTGEIYDYSRTTAKELFPYVDSVARHVTSDAKLYRVEGHHIGTDGKTGEWEYEFQSMSNRSTFALRLMGGRIGINMEHTTPPEHEFSSYYEIKDSWIDSDSAVFVAEQNGGEAFRNSHGNWEINANLWVTDRGFAQWEFHYHSEPDVEAFFVDAVELISYKAQDNLEKANTLARELDQDAKLVGVFAAPIDETGLAKSWNYYYRSYSSNNVYQLFTKEHNVYQSNYITGPFDANFYLNRDSIPYPWRDSDEVIQIAEERGGYEHRQIHEDWVIMAYILYYKSYGRARWRVEYYPGNVFMINAREYERVTARHRLSQIDSLANQISNGSELFFVVGLNLDHFGKTEHWFYRYRNPAQQYFEIWVLDNQVLQAEVPRFPNHNPDVAIPDYWMNSDTAIFMAEEQGGEEFRSQYSNVVIDMDLHAFSNKSGMGSNEMIEAMWNIYYNEPGGKGRHYGINAYSQFVNIGWPRYFGGEQVDMGMSVQETVDEGFIITGYTHSFGDGTADTWLLKTDSSGTIEWDKTFAGDFNNQGEYVELIAQNDYLIAHNHGRNPDLFNGSLLRTYNDGNEKLGRDFGGEGNNYIKCIHFTSDSNYVMAGYTTSESAGQNDVWLLKTDVNGNMLWSRTFGDVGNDIGEFMLETSDKGYIIVGTTDSHGAGGRDIWLIKTNENGNQEWMKTFGGPMDDSGEFISNTNDDGYILAGTTNSFGAGNEDFWLIKTDANGNEEWNKTFGGAENDFANAIQQTPDGGYVVVGNTQSYGPGDRDIMVIKTDSLGNELWNQILGGLGDDLGNSVCITSDGDFVIAGASNSDGHGNYDVFLTKIENDGIPTNVNHSPKIFSRLAQNFPNPFRENTSIRFTLEKTEYVRLTVLNLMGQIIEVLVNEKLPPGEHMVSWNGKTANDNFSPNGIYLYQITVNEEKEIKRMVYMK